MKRTWLCFLMMCLAAGYALGAPLRVALLDFQNEADVRDLAGAAAGVTDAGMAKKGALLLGDALLGDSSIALIDRRAFFEELKRQSAADDGELSLRRPGVLQAAQAVNADAVVRGSLVSCSTESKTIRQGGYETAFTKLTVRIVLEALDTRSGTVVALSEGVASINIRQTESVQTVLGADGLYELLKEAVREAVPEIRSELASWSQRERERPTVKIRISTSDDPALVELDGLLVGTTPLEDYEVSRGDHLLTVGKAGFRDVSKRILFDRDMAIEVPLIRTELTAEELKEVLESIRMDVLVGEPGLVIRHLDAR